MITTDQLKGCELSATSFEPIVVSEHECENLILQYS